MVAHTRERLSDVCVCVCLSVYVYYTHTHTHTRCSLPALRVQGHELTVLSSIALLLSSFLMFSRLSSISSSVTAFLSSSLPPPFAPLVTQRSGRKIGAAKKNLSSWDIDAMHSKGRACAGLSPIYMYIYTHTHIHIPSVADFCMNLFLYNVCMILFLFLYAHDPFKYALSPKQSETVTRAGPGSRQAWTPTVSASAPYGTD